MESDITNIQKTCGSQPLGVFYEDPGNNPNYVFISDSNFDPVKLFDPDGNIIFVNSWVECVHYLKGGWLSSQLVSQQVDKYLSIGLFATCCLLTLFVIFKNQKKNVKA